MNLYPKIGILFFILFSIAGVFTFLNFEKIKAAPILVRQSESGTITTNASQANSPDLASGLVGYWSFDGQQMYNNVADTSGQGNTGYLTNFTSTTTVPGVIGQALQFDGVDDYVDLGTGALGYTNLSISFWVKYIDDGVCGDSFEGIISKEDFSDFVIAVDCTGTNANTIVAYFVNTSSVGSGTIYSTTLVNDNNWHHVGLVADGTNLNMYIDGIFEISAALSGNVDDGNTQTTIGKYSTTASRELNGMLDEIRIYNRALSASEITELYNQGAKKILTTNASQANSPDLASGLVGYWSFDGQQMYNNVADTSGQGNTGYLTNFTSTTTVPGVIGQALQFDGVDDYVDVGSGASLELQSHTISAWVYVDSLTSTLGSVDVIFARSNSILNGGFEWGITNSAGTPGYFSFAYNDGSIRGWYNDTTVVNTGVWTHIVGVWDKSGGTASYYINGVLSSSDVTTTNSIVYASDSASIGYQSSNDKFDGKIDETRIYNRALSQSEITELYNQGR